MVGYGDVTEKEENTVSRFIPVTRVNGGSSYAEGKAVFCAVCSNGETEA